MDSTPGDGLGGKPRGQDGAALVMALVVALTVLSVGGAFLILAVTDRRIAQNEAVSARVFNLAEAGVQHAIAELPDRDVDALLGAGGSLFANQDMGSGSYSVTVTNNVSPRFPTGGYPEDLGGATSDSDGLLVLSATARLGRASRALEVIVQKTTGSGVFDYALFGHVNFKSKPASVIYGDIGGNGDIDLDVTVNGDASMVGVINNPGNVTGTVTTGAAPVPLPEVACPTGPYGPAPAGPDVDFDAGNGKARIGDGTTTWTSGTYYFVDLLIDATGENIVPAGHDVVIYVAGSFKLNDGIWRNLNNSAGTLRIYGCGTDGSGWTLDATDTLYMTVYATHHQMSIGGDGDKYGSFILEDVDLQDGGDIFYESGVDLGGGGGTAEYDVVSWREVW